MTLDPGRPEGGRYTKSLEKNNTVSSEGWRTVPGSREMLWIEVEFLAHDNSFIGTEVHRL